MNESCNLQKTASSAYDNVFWTNDMCDGVSGDPPANPEPYFPQVDSCSCLTDTNGPSQILGIGCTSKRAEKPWCYVADGCDLETNPSVWFAGLLTYSYEICNAENNPHQSFAAISLSANVENYEVKEASNTDIFMYAGCAVATLIAFVWQVKRTFATTNKHMDGYQSASALERLI